MHKLMFVMLGFVVGMGVTSLAHDIHNDLNALNTSATPDADGEHIARPAKDGLSVTIDAENGMVCYRERYGNAIALNCHPYYAGEE